MQRERRSVSAFWDNLRQPMPMGLKLRTIISNRVKLPPPTCCNRPGEPGC